MCWRKWVLLSLSLCQRRLRTLKRGVWRLFDIWWRHGRLEKSNDHLTKGMKTTRRTWMETSFSLFRKFFSYKFGFLLKLNYNECSFICSSMMTKNWVSTNLIALLMWFEWVTQRERKGGRRQWMEIIYNKFRDFLFNSTEPIYCWLPVVLPLLFPTDNEVDDDFEKWEETENKEEVLLFGNSEILDSKRKSTNCSLLNIKNTTVRIMRSDFFMFFLNSFVTAMWRSKIFFSSLHSIVSDFQSDNCAKKCWRVNIWETLKNFFVNPSKNLQKYFDNKKNINFTFLHHISSCRSYFIFFGLVKSKANFLSPLLLIQDLNSKLQIAIFRPKQIRWTKKNISEMKKKGWVWN